MAASANIAQQKLFIPGLEELKTFLQVRKTKKGFAEDVQLQVKAEGEGGHWHWQAIWLPRFY